MKKSVWQNSVLVTAAIACASTVSAGTILSGGHGAGGSGQASWVDAATQALGGSVQGSILDFGTADGAAAWSGSGSSTVGSARPSVIPDGSDGLNFGTGLRFGPAGGFAPSLGEASPVWWANGGQPTKPNALPDADAIDDPIVAQLIPLPTTAGMIVVVGLAGFGLSRRRSIRLAV
jgi:hypothetical protein